MTDRTDERVERPDGDDGGAAVAAPPLVELEPIDDRAPIVESDPGDEILADDADDADDALRDSAQPITGGDGNWLQRAGHRIVRRPVTWATRPWTPERIIQFGATAITLTVSTIIMMKVVHFFPGDNLIFVDNTPTGGDMGAHVWGPAYLRDVLLPNGQLNGWTMDWYGGMPAYRFYMVLPALAIVAVDTILPYGIAFKLVAISGLVLFPISCWSFGRMARFRYPLPELFAFAGLAFALDESFSIYGGNLKSTMAGEFSFSIALTLGMFGLGFLARGLETGRYKVWAAVLLAAACVSHGIVLMFVATVAVALALIWLVVSLDWWRLAYAAIVGVTTFLLSAFWVGPFLGNHDFMTDMKYEPKPSGGSESFWDLFFPLTAPLNILITTLALIGVASVALRRQINGVALAVSAFFAVAGVYAFSNGGLPGIGLLWNPRLLPFLYLLRYLLMMVGIVEVASIIRNLVLNRPAGVLPGFATRTATLVAGGLGVLVVLGFLFETLPFGGYSTVAGKSVYAWGPFHKNPHEAEGTVYKAEGIGWSSYNFKGYEDKNPYAEYHDVVQTMDDLGAENGCGRAFWEHGDGNGSYGTPMALMLLPFWTDGCIGSMEGLFFEASGTTPYHFVSTAAMSESSSNPVRELRYTQLDAGAGVPQLQSLGVRYVMLRSDAAKAEAANRPELTPVAESPPWSIYQLAESDIVTPLATQPVVVSPRSGDQRERNLELGMSWFQNQADWQALPADDGPEIWQRVEVAVDESRAEENRVDVVTPTTPIQRVDLPQVNVSNVEVEQQSLSFDVDEVGVPVLVRVSYFPNWHASGADGPYRIAPNMMVVIPTDTHVELDYGQSTRDFMFYAMTLAGIALCIVMRVIGDRPRVSPWPPADWYDDGTWDWGEPDADDAADETWKGEGIDTEHADGVERYSDEVSDETPTAIDVSR